MIIYDKTVIKMVSSFSVGDIRSVLF